MPTKCRAAKVLTCLAIDRTSEAEALQADIFWLDKHPEVVPGAGVARDTSNIDPGHVHGDGGGDSYSLNEKDAAAVLLGMAQTGYPAQQQQQQQQPKTVTTTSGTWRGRERGRGGRGVGASCRGGSRGLKVRLRCHGWEKRSCRVVRRCRCTTIFLWC